uniref:Uncharacterized protein n=1 Tax=Anguilla anguilla TaxID=7936 RepID=A0A0E9XG50_ANGAN
MAIHTEEVQKKSIQKWPKWSLSDSIFQIKRPTMHCTAHPCLRTNQNSSTHVAPV